MFFTQPGAEIKPQLSFDLAIKRWAVVERDLESPWFQLSLSLTEGEFGFARTLLIADIEHLANMLEAVPPGAATCVMVMTPPWLNGSKLWQMEHVLAIDIQSGVNTLQTQATLTTETGNYVLPTGRLGTTQRLYTLSGSAAQS